MLPSHGHEPLSDEEDELENDHSAPGSDLDMDGQDDDDDDLPDAEAYEALILAKSTMSKPSKPSKSSRSQGKPKRAPSLYFRQSIGPGQTRDPDPSHPLAAGAGASSVAGGDVEMRQVDLGEVGP